jgi:histidine triad (HIT) family protein
MKQHGETLFGKIIRKEIPATIVYESDTVLAFRDVQPVAPVHILVIPKKPIASLAAATPEDAALLGEVLIVCGEIARSEGLEEGGYRVVTNTGSNAGQSVFHIHFHILGGRQMAWPPG